MGPARAHRTGKGSQGAVVKSPLGQPAREYCEGRQGVRWDSRQGSIHPILIFFSIQGERLHLKIDFLFIEGVSVPLFSFNPGF